MFNIKRGNFVQAGKAAADDAVRSFAAARRNSPDFGKMAQQAASIRSKVKQEGIAAAAKVTKAGIDTAGSVESNRIKETAGRKLDKAKRKAGALSVAGKMFATAGQYGGEPRKKRDISDSSPLDARIESLRSKAAELRDQADGVTIPQASSSTPSSSTGSGGSTNSSSSSTSTSTVASSSGSGSSSSGGSSNGSTAMRLMTDLTNDGYSAEQAAAIVGNAQYESANFTAHEEFSPNSYGTKGAGFLQWTNAGGSNRRSNFESWSASQGLDPKSYEASSGFMRHELSGGAGSHWTGGMNDQSFRQIGDLTTAVNAFQNNYLRPAAATANNSQRQKNAQAIYQQWMNQQ